MKKISLFLFFYTCVYLIPFGISQNSVGLISMDKERVYDGFNLFFPHNQSSVFLTNNCGELINEWTDSDDFRPGNMAYLTEEGNLLKCKRFFNATADSIWAGGGGETVEMRDWGNNLLWSYTNNDEFERLHHDVALLPNGNVLMIAWELKTGEEVEKAGRNPESLFQNKLWPDYILEYAPTLDSIVWEWHVWDHLIQDFDSSKDNFGIVSEHPELVDINWNTNDGFPDWMHSNAIDYNEELDQILLCVPHFHEIWIIDHSTTTEEAKGHTGGRSGKGGDLLFRWGNPVTYKVDGQQEIFFAHDAQWVDNFLDKDDPYYGAISIFNNRVAEDYSTANIIHPRMDAQGAYLLEEAMFLPTDFVLTLTHPDTFSLYSNSLSGVQVLPNNNLLICSGRWGRIFEIDPTDNAVVWEYIIPLKAGSPVDQGTALVFNNNINFRFTRYPNTYAAFEEKDITPKGYIELMPNIDFCKNLVSSIPKVLVEQVVIYPNPVTDNLTIDKGNIDNQDWTIYNVLGQPLKSLTLTTTLTSVDISNLEKGIYFLGVEGTVLKKFLVY